MTNTGDQSRALITGIYQAVTRGAYGEFLASLHEDIRISSCPYIPGGGADMPLEKWQRMLDTLGMLDLSTLTVEELIVDGEKVSAAVRVGIKNSQDSVSFCENWTIRDGKAYRMRVYCYDPSILLKHLAGSNAVPGAFWVGDGMIGE